MSQDVYIGKIVELAEKAWAIGHAHEHPEDMFSAFMFLIANDDNCEALSDALDKLNA